jgi:hypothetical protein
MEQFNNGKFFQHVFHPKADITRRTNARVYTWPFFVLIKKKMKVTWYSRH